MALDNYIERSHTTVTMEVGFGEGLKGSGSFGVNIDRETHDVSFTACVSPGITAGEAYGTNTYNVNAPSGVAESTSFNVVPSISGFVGAGPLTIDASLDLFSADPNIRAGIGKASGIFGIGLRYDISLAFCAEINISHYLRQLGKVLRTLDLDFEGFESQMEKVSVPDDKSSESSQDFHSTREYHLLDPGTYNFETQIPSANHNIGEVSSEPIDNITLP